MGKIKPEYAIRISTKNFEHIYNFDKQYIVRYNDIGYTYLVLVHSLYIKSCKSEVIIVGKREKILYFIIITLLVIILKMLYN